MYKYHLRYWGQIENKDHLWIEKELGIKETDFWFNTAQERKEFKSKLREVADKHNSCIVFSEHEGDTTHLRTIACMTFIHPNGKEYYYEEDFGYGYSESAAEYMFFDGNYSCDCNRSLFLSRLFPEVEETRICGETISIRDFKIELRE